MHVLDVELYVTFFGVYVPDSRLFKQVVFGDFLAFVACPESFKVFSVFRLSVYIAATVVVAQGEG